MHPQGLHESMTPPVSPQRHPSTAHIPTSLTELLIPSPFPSPSPFSHIKPFTAPRPAMPAQPGVTYLCQTRDSFPSLCLPNLFQSGRRSRSASQPYFSLLFLPSSPPSFLNIGIAIRSSPVRWCLPQLDGAVKNTCYQTCHFMCQLPLSSGGSHPKVWWSQPWVSTLAMPSFLVFWLFVLAKSSS